jgi:hypothetical protein
MAHERSMRKSTFSNGNARRRTILTATHFAWLDTVEGTRLEHGRIVGVGLLPLHFVL